MQHGKTWRAPVIAVWLALASCGGGAGGRHGAGPATEPEPDPTPAPVPAVDASVAPRPAATPDASAAAEAAPPAADAAPVGASDGARTTADAARDVTAAAAPARNVLFIGDSYTYTHDIPGILWAFAKASQVPVARFEARTPGGSFLAQHWSDGGDVVAIKAQPSDHVVLQEHPLAIGNCASNAAQCPAYYDPVRKFDQVIDATGARTTIYAIWPGRNPSQAACAAAMAAQTRIAKEVGAEVVPAGAAVAAAMAAMPGLALQEDDIGHPSPAGSYLVACVFYATLFGRTPVGLPASVQAQTPSESYAQPVSVPPAVAAFLQRTAWETVQSYRSGQ